MKVGREREVGRNRVKGARVFDAKPSSVLLTQVLSFVEKTEMVYI